MGESTILWAVRLALWSFLIWRGIRLRLIPRYPWVFAMILISIAAGAFLGIMAAVSGADNLTYAIAWFVCGYLMEAVSLVAVLKIHAVLEKLSLRRHWYLVVLFVAAGVVPFVENPQGWFSLQFYSGMRLGVFALAIAALFESVFNRRLYLGWNLTIVLLAITVPDFFSFIVFETYSSGIISHEIASLWSRYSGIATWVVLSCAMLEYSPPRLRESAARRGSGLEELRRLGGRGAAGKGGTRMNRREEVPG